MIKFIYFAGNLIICMNKIIIEFMNIDYEGDVRIYIRMFSNFLERRKNNVYYYTISL